MKLLIKQLLTKSLLENDYKGSHTAPDKESGEPLYDLINTYGEDIYGPNAVRYYGGGRDSTIMDNFSVTIIKSVRNKPNAQVKIYRAVPKDVMEINNGDWVTTNPTYAKEHGRIYLDNKYKVLSKIVSAKDVYSDGNSIHEYGYSL